MPQEPSKRSDETPPPRATGRWRPRAPLPRLGAVTLAAAGLSVALLKAIDDELHGLGLLALVTLATVGALLVVEAWDRGGRGRTALTVAGGCTVVTALAVTVLSTPSQQERVAQRPPATPSAPSPSSPPSPSPRTPPSSAFRSHPLRAAFVAGDPGVFEVALRQEIGLPADGTGWRELIARGGIDVSDSAYRATFANRSDRPLTITDVHVSVLRTEPPPQGTFAYAHAQGESLLRRLFAEIQDPRPGANDWLYSSSAGDGVPYFSEHYVSLRPGEIYETTITIRTELPSEIRYRFVVAGSTPTGAFTFEDPHVRRISGLADFQGYSIFGRYYVKGYLWFLKHAMRCSAVVVHDWYAESAAHPLSGTCDT